MIRFIVGILFGIDAMFCAVAGLATGAIISGGLLGFLLWLPGAHLVITSPYFNSQVNQPYVQSEEEK